MSCLKQNLSRCDTLEVKQIKTASCTLHYSTIFEFSYLIQVFSCLKFAHMVQHRWFNSQQKSIHKYNILSYCTRFLGF